MSESQISKPLKITHSAQEEAPGSESESGTGSGVIFKKDSNKAYIITNNHVVEGANKLTVTLYNGETETAKLVGSDTITDLAVLEISSKNVKKVASLW